MGSRWAPTSDQLYGSFKMCLRSHQGSDLGLQSMCCLLRAAAARLRTAGTDSENNS